MADQYEVLDCNHDGHASQEEIHDFVKYHRQKRFQSRFNSVDADSNGQLNKEEAKQGFPHLAKRFDQLDVNHDGQLSIKEIRTFHHQHAIDGRNTGPSY